MKNIKLLLGILSVFTLLFIAGCQDLDSVNDNDQQGRLVIKLTDAPFPIDMIDAAMVYVTKVEVRKITEGEEDGYPFIEVFEGSEEFNLLDLRNGVTADLVDVEIAQGTYDLIRLYVDEVGLTVKEGETYNLKVPSGSQTGIKIFLDPAVEVVGGLTAELLLDINLEKSFILKGNTKSPAGIKGFNFKPVIRAANISTTGSIEGLVTTAGTALYNASVLMEQIVDQDTIFIASAFTDEAGYYAMLGISAGLYRLSATLEDFDTVAVENLEIVAGNLIQQDFILTPLEEEAVEE